MLPFLISIFYTITIIIATFWLLTFHKELKQMKFFVITFMWAYALWKWLLLKLPVIKMMSWITFWDSLLFWLLLFSFIVLPFFNIFAKYIEDKKLNNKDENIIFWLFIWFLVFHSIPEAIQVWYQYTFSSLGTIWSIIKAIIEEIPEFIMLLSLYIIMTNNKTKALILWILTWLIYPITTLLVSIMANNANEWIEILFTNILLWFYITFWIMCFNLLFKYNKVYLVLFIFLIILILFYRNIIWI